MHGNDTTLLLIFVHAVRLASSFRHGDGPSSASFSDSTTPRLQVTSPPVCSVLISVLRFPVTHHAPRHNKKAKPRGLTPKTSENLRFHQTKVQSSLSRPQASSYSTFPCSSQSYLAGRSIHLTSLASMMVLCPLLPRLISSVAVSSRVMTVTVRQSLAHRKAKTRVLCPIFSRFFPLHWTNVQSSAGGILP